MGVFGDEKRQGQHSGDLGADSRTQLGKKDTGFGFYYMTIV